MKFWEAGGDLDKAPEEFWKGMRFALARDEYPYRFRLLDPAKYGEGVPFRLFERIMTGMLDGKLSEEQTAVAIERLAQAATEAQWRDFFRPILERDVPLDVAAFNRHAPEALRLPMLRQYDPKLVAAEADLRFPMLLEPVYPGEPVLFFVTKNEVEAVGYDGRPYPLDGLEDDLRAVQALDAPGIVLDAVIENAATVILRDILSIERFRARGPTPPLAARRAMLEKFFYGAIEQRTEAFDLAETSLVRAYNESLIQFDLMIQQGFDRVYGRSLNGTWWEHQDVLIAPSGNTALKLSALNSGPDNSRFEKTVWSLEGVVPRSKKKQAHEIVLGLTTSQRKELWNTQQQCAGRKFFVSSCGKLDDGRMMFARFLNWSE